MMDEVTAPGKTAKIIADWNDLRQNPAAMADFRDRYAGQSLFILSQKPTPTAIPMPRCLVTDTRLMSPARLVHLCNQTQRKPASPRFGLIVSNGFGLGHVSRMQAIGQGLQQFGPVKYMSFSGGLVTDAYYLPSPQYLDLKSDAATAYVRESVLRFINHFAPTHVMYDGNTLPDGLLAALASRPDIHLTWVRRVKTLSSNPSETLTEGL